MSELVPDCGGVLLFGLAAIGRLKQCLARRHGHFCFKFLKRYT